MRKTDLRPFRSPPNTRSINLSVSSIEEFDNEDCLDHSFKLTMFPTLSTSALWHSPAPNHRSLANLDHLLAETLCIECEKKDKLISDLKLAVQNTRSQAVLTEKHLKQYDRLLHLKDNRLKEEEQSLSKKILEFEQQKLSFKSIAEEIQLENSKIIIEKQKILKEKQDLEFEASIVDKKRVQLEKLLREYRELKSDYMNFTEVQESISTNMTEHLLFRREEEIQRLMEEVSLNRADSDERKYETVFGYPNELYYNKMKSKNSSLKKYESELLRLKALVLKEREDQSKRFEERMDQIREKEIVLETAKEKIIEAQKLMSNEIKSIERIKKKLSMKIEISDLDEIKRSPNRRGTISEKSPMAKEMIDFSQEFIETQVRLEERGNENFEESLNISEIQIKLEEKDREKAELLAKIDRLIIEKKEAEENMKEMAENLDMFKIENGQQFKNLNENLMKHRISSLETLISVEGKKLKDQIEVLTHENKELKSKNLEISEKYDELFNDFEVAKIEKEKFRIISESLHNHINGIRRNTESEAESNTSFDRDILDLKTELEEKLDLVKNKEVELLNFEERLNQDREDLNKAAEYIRLLGRELAEKKEEIDRENDLVKNEKIKIANLNKLLEEKSYFLTEKEKEIFGLKEKIEEREKLIQSRPVVV